MDKVFILILILIGLFGCSTKIEYYSRPYIPKNNYSDISIYKYTKPEFNYVKIAKLTNNSIIDIFAFDGIIKTALNLGADAIILTDGNNKIYGLDAIAVKFE